MLQPLYSGINFPHPCDVSESSEYLNHQLIKGYSSVSQPLLQVGAGPQEGGGIAEAWIRDPKVYPEYQYPMTVFVPEGTVVVIGDSFAKILGILLVIPFYKLTTKIPTQL